MSIPYRALSLVALLSLLNFSYISIVESELTTKPIISFCAGYYHACAVFNTKQVKCWGKKYSLGISLDNVEQVSCGDGHVCMKLDSNNMTCIGDNFYGQSGLGLSTNPIGSITGYIGNSLPVVKLGSDVLVSNIVSGVNHNCALTSIGKVKCFGRSDYGQLAMGDTSTKGTSPNHMGDNLSFVDLGTNIEAASIHSSSSANHNCIIVATPAPYAQQIKCWGANTVYQLGYGDVNNRGDQSSEMGDNLGFVNLGTESRVKQLAIGWQHTCALLITDDLKCFGDGTFGELNSGSTSSISLTGNSTPTLQIDIGKKVKFITAGREHTCVGYDDMTSVKCVGDNAAGQLGQGDTTQRGDKSTNKFRSFPAINLGTGLLNISSVYAGSNYNCVMFADSSVKCFGDNYHGQLGIGSTKNIGDGSGEMGDKLQFSLLLGTFAPTMSPTKTPTLRPTLTPTNPTKTPSTSPIIPTSTTNTPQSPTLSPVIDKGSSSTMIIGISIGVPLAFIILAVVIWFRYRSKSNQKVDRSSSGAIQNRASPSIDAIHASSHAIQKKYLAFLSHAKAETGTVATLISAQSKEQLKKRNIRNLEIFLDSNNLTDLRELSMQVQQSKVMVAMLSKSYLTRPWCLIELHFALSYDIPIVAANIAGAGYDFERAKKFLQNLSKESLEEVNEGASKEMTKLEIDIKQLGQRLVEELPNIIARPYDPTATARVQEAQLNDLFEVIIAKANKV